MNINWFRICPIALLLSLGAIVSCRQPDQDHGPSLQQELIDIVNRAPGTVGVAVVSAGDTILINNGVRYPMMSVFKLHQAIATADALRLRNATLDSALTIRSSELNRDTWSPVLSRYIDPEFKITVAELLKATIVYSDNNASNLLFDKIISPVEVDSAVKSLASDTTFRIAYSEAEMKSNHELSYSNYTSPLAAALLIKEVFNRELIGEEALDSIRAYLSATSTGADRLGAAIDGIDDVRFAHKTGSGYRNSRGALVAHNDVGVFLLPDGRSYSVAVLIKDFDGTDAEASGVIADISRCVYARFCNK